MFSFNGPQFGCPFWIPIWVPSAVRIYRRTVTNRTLRDQPGNVFWFAILWFLRPGKTASCTKDGVVNFLEPVQTKSIRRDGLGYCTGPPLCTLTELAEWRVSTDKKRKESKLIGSCASTHATEMRSTDQFSRAGRRSKSVKFLPCPNHTHTPPKPCVLAVVRP